MSERLEVVLEFNGLSSALTNCTDCDAAFISLACAGEGAFFRSLCTVAKADWAVDKSPEFSALPTAARSMENGELLDPVLPLAAAAPSFSFFAVWNADWAPFRSPDARLFWRLCKACCICAALLDESTY